MISCHQHDYIEIACLYHLRVLLTQDDGKTQLGIAQTTQSNADKQECLVIDVEGYMIEVILKSLISMQALDKNPHFDTIIFKQQ